MSTNTSSVPFLSCMLHIHDVTGTLKNTNELYRIHFCFLLQIRDSEFLCSKSLCNSWISVLGIWNPKFLKWLYGVHFWAVSNMVAGQTFVFWRKANTTEDRIPEFPTKVASTQHFTEVSSQITINTISLPHIHILFLITYSNLSNIF